MIPLTLSRGADIGLGERLAAAKSAAVRVASIAHLIAMKEAVGRPQDVNDVRALRALQSRR